LIWRKTLPYGQLCGVLGCLEVLQLSLASLHAILAAEDLAGGGNTARRHHLLIPA